MNWPAVLPLGVLALLVLVWALFRRGGYKRRPLDAPPGPDWEATSERFIDPGTGTPIRVYVRRRDGWRAYVRDGAPQPVDAGQT